MKKTIIFLAIVTFMITAKVATSNMNEKKIGNTECQYGQCIYMKENNERCKNCCQRQSAYCWTHDHNHN